MHEIITLQLGHQANYLGTHFWNTQESYFTYDSDKASSPVNHDIHFRAGLGPRGDDTFTPRVLIYDLKGGFGSLRRGAGLYELVEDEGGLQEVKNDVWNGNVVVRAETLIPRSDYQNDLDQGVTASSKLGTATVRYWSDFNRVFYHPRSIVQIYDYELGSSLMPFEKWDSGEELFAGMDRETDLLDRDFRPWAEECDHMQGVQVFTGGDDGWGGFGAKYVERLRDEFGKTTIWVWGLEEEAHPRPKSKELLRTVNVARSMHDFSASASMYIPMSVQSSRLPPYIRLDSNSAWHTSALLVAALESVTLPTRLRSNSHKQADLDSMEAILNGNGNQNIACLRGSFIDPLGLNIQDSLPSDQDTSHRKTLNAMDNDGSSDDNFDIDFSSGVVPGAEKSSRQRYDRDHVFGRVESWRGLSFAAQVEEENNIETRKRRRLASLPVIERYHSTLSFPLLDSFPAIVDSGWIIRPRSIAVAASILTTTKTSGRIKALQQMVVQNVPLQDRETLSNGLGDISEAYEEGWESGSDYYSDD